MKRSLIVAILLLWYVAPAQGDMTLSFREVGNSVVMHLRGSIDISGLEPPEYSMFLDTGGVYAHSGDFVISSGGGSRGVGYRTRVITDAVTGDTYNFSSASALTRIGTPPPLRRGVLLLAASPPFWFGFLDATRTAGGSGAILDQLYLTDGYISNEYVNLSHIVSNRNFIAFGLSLGDLWGVSFSSPSGTQQILFHAIPEPFSALLLTTMGAVLIGRRR